MVEPTGFLARGVRIALGAALLATPAPAGPPPPAEVGDLVARLQASYDRLDTLRADFVQTLSSVALGEPQEERGVLYLRRPALMRWEYRRPEFKLAVVDGTRTWLYIPAENQVIVGTLEEVQRSGVAGLLLAGRVDLQSDFEVRPNAAEEAPPSGTAALTLIPRGPAKEFTRIDVTFSLETDLPIRIAVHGSLGEVMEYRFSHVRTGMPLDRSLFLFEPPEGVEVVLAE